jgi:hypothetical protein
MFSDTAITANMNIRDRSSCDPIQHNAFTMRDCRLDARAVYCGSSSGNVQAMHVSIPHYTRSESATALVTGLRALRFTDWPI